jgi:hypothetical protein
MVKQEGKNGGKMGRIADPYNAKSYGNLDNEVVEALEVLSHQIFNLHKDMDDWEKERRAFREHVDTELNMIKRRIEDIG